MVATRRTHWLDAARSLAIVLVVMCHSVEAYFALNREFVSGLDFASKGFAFVVFNLGRIGVPLFLFISGFLLLDRDWTPKSIMAFWKSRWLPLLLCVETWVVLYNVFLWSNGHPIEIKRMICNMLFVGRIDMKHFWYMPVILGLYLFLPIMGLALKQLKPRTVAFPLAVVSLYAFGIPIVAQIFDTLHKTIKPMAFLDLGFSGGIYGIYLIFGWCVKRGAFKKLSAPALGLIALASFLGCVLLQTWCYENGSAYNVWYNNGLLLLCGLSLFELFSHLPNRLFVRRPDCEELACERTMFGRACYCISYYSFAIYLVHYPILLVLTPYIDQIPIMPSAKTAVAFCALLTTSLAASWLLSKIPRVGKPLLYLK